MVRIPEYKNDKDDNFFKWKGVKPPERISHGISEDDIDTLLESNLKGHVCQWTQRGSYIVCDNGNFEHGKNIGTMKQLVGTSADGQPILKDIVLS